MTSNKKVLATGVFDILHPGHIYYLNEAKKLGGFLVVLVTSDKVTKLQRKNPMSDQRDRAQMVENLKMVDKVIIGYEVLDECRTILSIKPDIIALGWDQKYCVDDLREMLNKCGWNGEVIRIKKYPNNNRSTTNIIKTIQNDKQ